jgi:hypothetical protein
VRRLATVTAAGAAVLAAAGCGGTTQYALDPTRECLKQLDGLVVRDAPADDFIASSATGGAANVKFSDNQVTLTFSEDADQADNIATGYRRFKGKGIGIDSALEELKNVVMVWGVTPVPAEKQQIHSCLKG